MAQIPGAADLGNNIPQATRTPLTTPELYGAGLGRQIEQAGEERIRAERQAAAAAEAQRRAADKATALSEMQIAQDDLAAMNDEMAQGVRTGQVAKGDAAGAWKERSDERIARAIEAMPAEFRAIGQRELGARAARAGRNVGAAVLERDQHDVRAGIDQTLEYASRLYAKGERAQADQMVADTLEQQGPFSGLPADQLQKRGQIYREASRYTRASTLVSDARRSNQALDRVEKELAGDEFADMDPQRKQQLTASIDGYRVVNEQRAAAAAARAAAESDRRLRVAESTFNAASSLTNQGKVLTPEYVDQATKSMAGTPYLAAFQESLKVAPAKAAFAQQPLQVQQQALLQMRSQLNQRGTDPKLEKQIGELETMYRQSVQDYAAEPLQAALERGLLRSIEPLRTDSLPALVATIAPRVAQAQLVQQQVGEAVTPLMKAEAEQVAQLINVLPVQQRAQAVAQIASAVGAPVAQALGRQIADKDKALGLALAAGSSMTSNGRHTSELILRGAQAIKDKTIKADDMKVSGWRAEIAQEIGGAYSNDMQRQAAIESAYLIRAGLESEGSGNNRQAVRLATGGITDRNGKKVPLPYGMGEDDFEAKLKKLTPANVIGAQIPGAAKGQVEAGNINLRNRPVVQNPDGSVSTVRSISANFDGAEVLLPTISDDGKSLTDDQAVAQYRKTGKHLGKFRTPADATAYAQALHNQQAGSVAFIGGKPMPMTDFLARIPDAQLVHAGKSRYGVLAGGALATDARGAPLIIEVR